MVTRQERLYTTARLATWKRELEFWVQQAADYPNNTPAHDLDVITRNVRAYNSAIKNTMRTLDPADRARLRRAPEPTVRQTASLFNIEDKRH